MEYPGLCSVTAGMLIKKGGFVMCKRKIKTIEAIFFLFLFSVIVLLLPQDAHARVRVVTKGTTSTIRDTDGVIEDESSDINFPINIKNAKSSKPSVLAISENYLVPKKKGAATVTANLNGVNRKITITVTTPAAKPTVKNLTLNLKPGKTMTKTHFIQNMVQAPEKRDISVKCLKLNWK